MVDIWKDLNDRIKEKISPLNYNTWFEPIKKTEIVDGKLVVTVPNKFVKDWIVDYYQELMLNELHLLDPLLGLSFEISEDEEMVPIENLAPQKPQIAITPPVGLNQNMDFERFVVGDCSQFAYAAARAVSDMPGANYNPLFIYGGVGLGKTHLINAMGIEIHKKFPVSKIVYRTGEGFMNDLINHIRFQKMHEFRKKYRDACDVLLIDDIQFIAGKERTGEEFFHTFNFLHENQKQIVLTSDRLPKEIPGIEERLRSRFEWGLIADIQPPELETRIAILKKKADINKIQLSEDVLMYIATNIKSNIRELEGALVRLGAWASLTGSRIDLDFAKHTLKSLFTEKAANISIKTVQDCVADFYNLRISDLKSKRRTRNLAYPRQIAMYLCKKLLASSFPEIGSQFGGKDHSTVIHACKKIEALLQTDQSLIDNIERIEKSIQQ